MRLLIGVSGLLLLALSVALAVARGPSRAITALGFYAVLLMVSALIAEGWSAHLDERSRRR